MATYEITRPDGQTFEVTAPDTATEQQVLEYAKANAPTAGAAARAAPARAPGIGAPLWQPPPPRTIYQKIVGDPLTAAAEKTGAALDWMDRGFGLFKPPPSPPGTGRATAEAVVPQTPTEALALVGVMLAPPLAAGRFAPAAVRAFMAARPAAGPVAARVAGGTIGGEAGGLASGEMPGKGAAIGGGGALAGEAIGAGVGQGVTWLPGMKGLISRQDTARVGRTLEDFGLTGVRTPVDVLDATAQAITRREQGMAGYAAAQAAQRDAATAARREAAEQTVRGREDWRAEWQRRQQVAREATEAGQADWRTQWQRRQREAQEATAAARTASEAAGQRADATLREQNAAELQGIITRAVPQLGPAFGPPGTASLRGAATGGGRRVLGEAKEAVTRRLETAVPGGISVPSLFAAVEGELPVVSVRQAIDALSRLRLDARTQLQRNPADRDLIGRNFRRRYGRASREIESALNTAGEGLGDVFRSGQQEYKQGITTLREILQPNTTWTPTGEINAPALSSRLLKPRTEIAVKPKIGEGAYGEISTGVRGMSMDAPRHPVVPIEPVRPLDVAPVIPERPLRPARVYPDIPPEPPAPTMSAADTILTRLFGQPNEYVQGPSGTRINWPAAAKALQAPEIRSALIRHPDIGEAGYDRLIRSMLRGARQGADMPSRGTGSFLDPAYEVAGGRTQGFTGGVTAPLRTLFPNVSRYVGQHPGTVPPILQQILDLAMQKTGSRIFDPRVTEPTLR